MTSDGLAGTPDTTVAAEIELKLRVAMARDDGLAAAGIGRARGGSSIRAGSPETSAGGARQKKQ
jgi:hypothetical protein